MKKVTFRSDRSVHSNIYSADTHPLCVRIREGVNDTTSHEWTFFGGGGSGQTANKCRTIPLHGAVKTIKLDKGVVRVRLKPS